MNPTHTKIIGLALTALVTTTAAQASWLDVLIRGFEEDSYSKFHGEGLPKRVGQRREAIEYREDFKDRMGIYSTVDSLGLTQYSNNKIGLALIKKGNTDEAAFQTVLAQKDYRSLKKWRNGPQFLEALEDYTKENGCIPKITSVSHGWRSDERPGEGNGLSGNKGVNGIYSSNQDTPTFIARFGTRTLQKHLKQKIDQGKIEFCSACVVQFYACNVGADFASTFSQVSGCQTVVATGQNSPIFQSTANAQARQKIYSGAHYWKSAPGVWAESSSEAKKKGYDQLGTWFRSTPVKNSRGQVTGIVKENLGTQYIAL